MQDLYLCELKKQKQKMVVYCQTVKSGRCLILALMEQHIAVRSIFHFSAERVRGELAEADRIVVSSSCLLSKQATSLSFMFN